MSTYRKYPQGYYVYAYIRKSTSTPYYIGKGKGNRAWSKDHTYGPPNDNERIVILFSNLTESVALDIERRLIKLYGRIDNNSGILKNGNDGGFGGDMSQNLKYIEGMKKRKSRKGIAITQSHRDNIGKAVSIAKKGKRPPNYEKWIMSSKGKSYYHHPTLNIESRFGLCESIPDGFIKGRLKLQCKCGKFADISNTSKYHRNC
jgi:hypothetical protein